MKLQLRLNDPSKMYLSSILEQHTSYTIHECSTLDISQKNVASL
jgi:hypothetical protein